MADVAAIGQSEPRSDRGSSAADRKVNTRDMTAAGGVLGLVTGATDWLIFDCNTAGHWHLVPPTRNLAELAAFIIFLPVGLWFSQVLSIVGDIIINKLRRNDST